MSCSVPSTRHAVSSISNPVPSDLLVSVTSRRSVSSHFVSRVPYPFETRIPCPVSRLFPVAFIPSSLSGNLAFPYPMSCFSLPHGSLCPDVWWVMPIAHRTERTRYRLVVSIGYRNFVSRKSSDRFGYRSASLQNFGHLLFSNTSDWLHLLVSLSN